MKKIIYGSLAVGLCFLVYNFNVIDDINETVEDFFEDVTEYGTLYTIGDSITAGYPYEDEETHHYQYFLSNKLSCDYVNLGSSGAKLAGIITSFDLSIPENVTVIVNGGINDIRDGATTYEIQAYYEIIFSMAESNNNDLIILSMIPDTRYSHYERIDAVNIWFREWTSENGIVFIDCYDELLKDGSYWEPNPSLYEDHVHPTTEGHSVIGNVAFEVMK